MYTEIITSLSATGFLSLAFGSGILYQKVRGIKEELDKFMVEQVHGCELRHENDDEVLKAITKLATQVEALINNHKEFRSSLNRALEKKTCIESD